MYQETLSANDHKSRQIILFSTKNLPTSNYGEPSLFLRTSSASLKTLPSEQDEVRPPTKYFNVTGMSFHSQCQNQDNRNARNRARHNHESLKFKFLDGYMSSSNLKKLKQIHFELAAKKAISRMS